MGDAAPVGRQERALARATPERWGMEKIAQEVDEGVYRFRLASPSGLVVNAWLLRHDGGLTLVDTGFPKTVDQLEAGLQSLGCALRDVDHVLYTHTHVDHMGGGVALGDRWDALQWAWTHPASVFEDYVGHWERIPNHVEGFGVRLPDTPLRHAAMERLRLTPTSAYPSDRKVGLRNLQPVAPGESIAVGSLRLRCILADGHDPGHIVWLDETRGWAFSGDVVLNVPTPIVQYMGDRLPPYLRTLDRLAAAPIRKLFPGHGMSTVLVDQSLDRSRGYLRTQYDQLARGLEGHALDPLALLLQVLDGERRAPVARYGILLANYLALLDAMSALGYATQEADKRWRAARPWPRWEEAEVALKALP